MLWKKKGVGNNGWQLVHVANHKQLHAAEGSTAATVAPQGHVDGVEQVGAHHGYLVDDEQLEGTYDVELGLVYLALPFGHLVLGDKLLDVGQIRVEW